MVDLSFDALRARYLTTPVLLRSIPVGTGYAVWVGIGAAGTAIAGMLFYGEPAGVMRVLSLVLVLAGVVGLKLFH